MATSIKEAAVNIREAKIMAFETSTGMTPKGTFNGRTVTAFFDARADAEEAVEILVSEGFDRSAIRLVAGAEREGAATSSTAPGAEPQGFWDSLSDFFMPDEDRYSYAEGLSRGGVMVSVDTDDASYDRALDILDREGTIDIDERAEEWRGAGWTGYSGSALAPTNRSDQRTVVQGSDRDLSAGQSTADDFGSAVDKRAVSASGEEVIPVAEERLRVGKRDVSHGRVRVRSYVVEIPVEEEVRLREERVSVDRRPVDRSVSATDDPFRERTIELEQRGEEAVVSKDVRVTEELTLSTEASERSEKVADTVRRTEVEVVDERTGETATPKVSGAKDRRAK
jgi:uncharacterized protein (TIGR02271 family)